MNKLNNATQLELKRYLDNFYAEIYNVRLRIYIHIEIGNASHNPDVECNQYWGFIQQHENVSVAVLRMFAIFDDVNSHLFKEFCRFLRSKIIYILDENDLKRWIEILRPYEDFRNKIIAHASIDKCLVPPVIYDDFFKILSEFEAKLKKIQHEYITDYSVIYSKWTVSDIDIKTNLILSDLRKILRLSLLNSKEIII